MNIGIMVSSQTPQAGGGFTFEDEILEALCRLRQEVDHQFFLMGHQPERPAHLDGTGLAWLSLHRPRALRRRQKRARLLERLGRPFQLFQQSRTLDFEAYPSLKKQPLDLICYLTPLVRPVADIPYITNVWDVEHRQQPFFPEVSQQGEWESRERRYREIFSRAAYIVTPNQRGKEEIASCYGVPRERIRALAHPTPRFAREDLSDFPTVSLEHLGVRGDFLFYPAQFWPHKNHPCLLLALQFLKEQHGYTPQLVLTGADKGNRCLHRGIRAPGAGAGSGCLSGLRFPGGLNRSLSSGTGLGLSQFLRAGKSSTLGSICSGLSRHSLRYCRPPGTAGGRSAPGRSYPA